VDYSRSALPKGRTKKQLQSRSQRAEAKVKRAVRAACVERDGGCRLAGFFEPCSGAIEWCHLGEWKRSKTRGMAPEERHSTVGSFMACTHHHQLYDRGEIVIEYGPDGANGHLTLWRKAA
jgi:hypothetical protein